jgi:DUF438 domain-containing protein
MIEKSLMSAILDSLKNPILFADTDHMVRYMNAAALAHYEGGASLIGSSVLDCHNSESQQKMIEILAAMQAGETERLIVNDAEERIFMRVVRDGDGCVLGYYERYEPPIVTEG